MKLTSLLVGSHFRPPAKLVIASLPAGYRLRLDPEPSNEYDSNGAAIKVLCNPSQIPASQHQQLADELPNCGWDLTELLAAEELFLGYVAAERNKDLLAGQRQGHQWISNVQFLAVPGLPAASAVLAFAQDGKALVVLEC